MEDSMVCVSIYCDLNVILLTSLIALMHPPLLMTNYFATKLIYAKMDSSQSRHLQLSVMRNGNRERKTWDRYTRRIIKYTWKWEMEIGIIIERKQQQSQLMQSDNKKWDEIHAQVGILFSQNFLGSVESEFQHLWI